MVTMSVTLAVSIAQQLTILNIYELLDFQNSTSFETQQN